MRGDRYVVRSERPGDEGGVREVNRLAFGQPTEAALVDELRDACPECLSLVALDAGDAVVGHILFSPVEVLPADGAPAPPPVAGGMGLGPLAVLPERQRLGLGAALVERGIALLRERGCPFIIVLGHPGYYPRFGFVPASEHGLRAPWEGVPDEAFMVMVLHPAALAGVTGVARYRAEFDAAV